MLLNCLGRFHPGLKCPFAPIFNSPPSLPLTPDLVTSCSRRLTTFVILLIILVEHHGGILEKLFFLPYFCLPFPMAQFFS